VNLLAGLVAGVAVAFGLWRSLGPLFATSTPARPGSRQPSLSVPAGVIVVLTTAAVAGGYVVLEVLGWVSDPAGTLSRYPTVLAALGFGFLGLIDDLLAGAGTGAIRWRSEPVRLGGAILVALVVAGPSANASIGQLVVDAALIVVSADVFHRLRDGPGRPAKVGLAAFAVVVLATGASGDLAGPAIVFGAVAALLLPALRGRLVLGATAADVTGAAFGLGVVLACGHVAVLVVLAAVAAVDLAAQGPGLDPVFDTVPPLRAYDRWGRRI
jgi:hypothetical protein